MIAYVLYNKATEAERVSVDLAARLGGEQVAAQLLDADSPRGIELAEHYDILARPAVALIRDDGTPVQVWQGLEGLPAPSDVAYLAHQ